ncbi:MAG: YggS family pyridoxal phosphate-dependent enzyme [Phycisphaerae bacterium]|nr:YggS family pyridoxal phosphate-dependent enzyme [Phycisphaerae bacterium]
MGARTKGSDTVIGDVAAVRRRLSENHKRIRERISAACARAHRDPNSVRLLAVTKYVEMEVVRQALEMGILDLGESRAQQLNKRASMIQELNERRSVLTGGGGARRGSRAGLLRPRWHMVGHLQRNKVKLVLPWVELIHSVDSLRLPEDIHIQATKVGRVVDILLQVNTSGERSKFGVAVGAVTHLAEHFASWSGIRLCGLMTMGPLGGTPYEVRLSFDRLRDVFEEVRGERYVGDGFRELSMGMSGDFEIAVEAGATIVRIGSALFEGLTSPEGSAHTGES